MGVRVPPGLPATIPMIPVFAPYVRRKHERLEQTHQANLTTILTTTGVHSRFHGRLLWGILASGASYFTLIIIPGRSKLGTPGRPTPRGDLTVLAVDLRIV